MLSSTLGSELAVHAVSRQGFSAREIGETVETAWIGDGGARVSDGRNAEVIESAIPYNIVVDYHDGGIGGQTIAMTGNHLGKLEYISGRRVARSRRRDVRVCLTVVRVKGIRESKNA